MEFKSCQARDRHILPLTSQAAEAFDIVMHRGAIGEVYNVGSSERTSVRELADMIVQRVRRDGAAKPHVHVRDRAINDCRYALDCSKIETLGWTAKTSFDKGLDETIAWYGTGRVEQGHWESSACERAVIGGVQVGTPRFHAAPAPTTSVIKPSDLDESHRPIGLITCGDVIGVTSHRRQRLGPITARDPHLFLSFFPYRYLCF